MRACLRDIGNDVDSLHAAEEQLSAASKSLRRCILRGSLNDGWVPYLDSKHQAGVQMEGVQSS